MKNKKIVLTVLVFLILEAASFIYLEYLHKTEVENCLEEKTTELQVKQEAIQAAYEGMINLVFKQIISKPNVLKLYNEALYADSITQIKLRDSLYNILLPTYKQLKLTNIRQFIFIKPNNKVFIRFHRLEKYGDDLSQIRYSVKKANETKQKQIGFEEGRTYNGFRNIFPIYYNNKHIGVIEISFSFAVNALFAQDGGTYGFMVKKDIVNSKVSPNKKDNYTTSLLSNNYLHEKVFLQYSHDSLNIIKQIDKEIKPKISEQLANNENFTIQHQINKTDYFISFNSINNVEGKPVAYMFSYKKGGKIITDLRKSKTIRQISNALVLAILAFVILLSFLKKIRIKEIVDANTAERIKALKVLKESEAKLRESNATKDKFFSIIAHDLKSPFSSMLGFSELLNKNFDKYTTKKQKKFSNYIHQGIQNTYKLLNELLLWSQSQKGTISFNKEQLNLFLLSNEVFEPLKQAAENKSIKLNNKIPKDEHINADKSMLSTIIRNIFSNAIKFTPKGGKIIISTNKTTTENNKKFLEIRIKDTGIGIPKEIQPKLFIISENTSTLGTENEKGTGLGLILCKEFIEKHNGKIWIKSEEGEGSEFIFTLPV